MLIDLKSNLDSGELEGVAENFRAEGRARKELGGSGWIEVRGLGHPL